MPVRRTVPLADHFWSKVEKSNRCWLWQASRRPAGYGTYYINRVPMLAHRVAWELVHGPIPAGAYVLHHCDNPPCVRPDHLYLGTAGQNLRDAQQKGRFAISTRVRGRGRQVGEHHPDAKLTEAAVRSARADFENGWSVRQLAEHFGVSRAAMRSALTGKTWKHVR